MGWKRECEPGIPTQRSHLDFAEGSFGNIIGIPTYPDRGGIPREFSWECPQSGIWSHRIPGFHSKGKRKRGKAGNPGCAQWEFPNIVPARNFFLKLWEKSPHPPLCTGKGRKSGNPKAEIPKFPDFHFNSPENPGIYSHKKSSHSTTSAGIPSGIRVLQTEEAPGAASHFSMESPSRNLLYSIDFCSFPVSFFPPKYFWGIFLKGKI